MLKVVKAKVQNFTRMASLISGNPVQKLNAIHIHPCNPVLLLRNSCSNLFLLFLYLVAFGNITRNLESRNFFDHP